MVKTRLQSGSALYKDPISAAMSIYKNEGIRGFYRGTYDDDDDDDDNDDSVSHPSYCAFIHLVIQDWAQTWLV